VARHRLFLPCVVGERLSLAVASAVNLEKFMVFVPACYPRLLLLLLLVVGGCGGTGGAGGAGGGNSRFLIGSNSDGTLTTFYATADGVGLKPAAFTRISARSVESVTPHPNGKVVYALADDRVHTLKVDPVTGELTRIGTAVTGGGGFRLLLVDDTSAYVVNQISASITQYQVNPLDYTLVRVGTNDTSTEAGPVAMVTHPGGLFVFVINRDAGSMMIFVRDPESGQLLPLAF